MNISGKIRALLPKRVINKMQQKKDQRIKAQSCVQYPILDVSILEKYPQVYHIKDESWEKMPVAANYRTFQAYEVPLLHETQNIRLIQNACVCDGADAVITADGVIWDKAYYSNFTKVIPTDRNMYDYDDKHIWLKKYVNTVEVNGRALSLLGACAGIWAHFIIQYLPKIYYGEKAGLLNEDITILVSPVVDTNIKEIFDQYAAKYSAIKFVETLKDTYYKCEELYYMPSASHLDDHSLYLHTCDVVIPQIVKDELISHMVQPLIEQVKNNKPKHKKIYLIRRETFRKIANWKEIEQFFVEQGFCLVEGSNMSLLEKADLFYHTEFIAGPYSSAWTNTMFCKKAKGIMIENTPRTIDPYQVTFANIGHVKVLQVTGNDIGTPDAHMDSYIPIDKLKQAYEYLLKIDSNE